MLYFQGSDNLDERKTNQKNKKLDKINVNKRHSIFYLLCQLLLICYLCFDKLAVSLTSILNIIELLKKLINISIVKSNIMKKN